MATPPRYSHISVAIPLLAEKQNLLPLLSRFRCQTFSNFTLYLCVNNVEKGYGYDENQESLHLLRSISDLPLSIIDRSSHGLGWTGKRKGVGWARKLLFDRISNEHDGNELIISLDADTDFDNNYLEAVLHTMNTFPSANAFAIPYYHPLSGIETLDRPMLRYECYMRHYLINLLLINNPYAFSALGSAIAFPLWAYRRVGGITPLQGGEDFYLLQKFAKTGTIRQLFSPYSSITVRPQGRASSRVPFGTGPAIASGIDEMDLRYPFYPPFSITTSKPPCLPSSANNSAPPTFGPPSAATSIPPTSSSTPAPNVSTVSASSSFSKTTPPIACPLPNSPSTSVATPSKRSTATATNSSIKKWNSNKKTKPPPSNKIQISPLPLYGRKKYYRNQKQTG